MTARTLNPKLSILGIPCDILTFEQALKRMLEAMMKPEKTFCVTLNPEICLQALKNPEYFEALGAAEMIVPDGFGILFAGRYLCGRRNFLRWIYCLLTPWITRNHSPFPGRITGIDLLVGFFDQGKERKVFLLGARDEVNHLLSQNLKSRRVNIVGNFSGSPRPEEEESMCQKIRDSGADSLFVAFGAPAQELWIARNLPKLPLIKLAMGVGGSFDVLSGKKSRAPLLLQNLGLEWLYRLFKEPKRFRRILNATIVFPWKLLRQTG